MVLESFVLGLADGPTEVHKVQVAKQLLREYSRPPACSRGPTCRRPARRR